LSRHSDLVFPPATIRRIAIVEDTRRRRFPTYMKRHPRHNTDLLAKTLIRWLIRNPSPSRPNFARGLVSTAKRRGRKPFLLFEIAHKMTEVFGSAPKGNLFYAEESTPQQLLRVLHA
jgi:hypothetical protein